MTRKDIRKRMSLLHEQYISKLFNGTLSRGSGNQAANPMDGRQDRHRMQYALAWDCKATLGASISITLTMWLKAIEQARGEIPTIPLRIYHNDRLTEWTDLIVIGLEDFSDIKDDAETR